MHFTAHNGMTTSIDAKIEKSLMAALTSANGGGIAADCGGLTTRVTGHGYRKEPFASALGAPGTEETAIDSILKS